MKIILTENIKGLGQIGETKEVKNGYARNFLMPRKLAVLATVESLKQIDELKKLKNLTVQREIEKMKEVAGKIKDSKLVIETKADEKGHLYAALNPKKIGEAIREQGVEINSDYILVNEPIKKLGIHEVLFKYYDTEAKFEVEVVSI